MLRHTTRTIFKFDKVFLGFSYVFRPSTLMQLSNSRVALRAGLHCAPLAHRTAGTLPEGTIRLSLSAFTTLADVEKFLEISKRIRG